MTKNLKNTIEDFTVSIKYEEWLYSENFEKLLKNSLEYRTVNTNKAKLISEKINPLEFVEKLKNNKLSEVLKTIEKEWSRIFDDNEIKRICDIFNKDYLYENIESLDFEDKPKITVTKTTSDPTNP